MGCSTLYSRCIPLSLSSTKKAMMGTDIGGLFLCGRVYNISIIIICVWGNLTHLHIYRYLEAHSPLPPKVQALGYRQLVALVELLDRAYIKKSTLLSASKGGSELRKDLAVGRGHLHARLFHPLAAACVVAIVHRKALPIESTMWKYVSGGVDSQTRIGHQSFGTWGWSRQRRCVASASRSVSRSFRCLICASPAQMEGDQ